jgi:hypothetical protein
MVIKFARDDGASSFNIRPVDQSANRKEAMPMKCEICQKNEAMQTCSQCGKKFCPACRSQSAGGRPICRVCGAD